MVANNKIERIKSIVEEWGPVKLSELKTESPILINSIGNVAEFVRSINYNGVGTSICHNYTEIDQNFVYYEDLNDKVVGEVYDLAIQYEKDMINWDSQIRERFTKAN